MSVISMATPLSSSNLDALSSRRSEISSSPNTPPVAKLEEAEGRLVSEEGGEGRLVSEEGGGPQADLYSRW